MITIILVTKSTIKMIFADIVVKMTVMTMIVIIMNIMMLDVRYLISCAMNRNITCRFTNSDICTDGKKMFDFVRCARESGVHEGSLKR